MIFIIINNKNSMKKKWKNNIDIVQLLIDYAIEYTILKLNEKKNKNGCIYY